MKKTILAVALATLSTGTLACQPYCGDTNTQSTAAGFAGSGSYTSSSGNGLDVALHGAFAKSGNATEVAGKGGIVGIGNFSSGAGATSATTAGYTLTGAAGFGKGGAAALAEQSGVGSINVYDSYCRGRDFIDLTSTVATNSWSGVKVTDTGAALSGTVAGATNATVGAGYVSLFSSKATGLTEGLSGSTSWSLATPGDLADAKAFAGQQGSYDVKFGKKYVAE